MKQRLIAAIDGSAVAPSVLAAAEGVARMLGASVDVVHVSEDEASDAATRAAVRDAPLREITGPVVKSLAIEAEPSDVVGLVLGARGSPEDVRPAGSTALAVITGAEKLVAVVPPDGPAPTTIRRLLVPLDGTTSTAQAIWDVVRCACTSETEVIVLHVLDEASAPPYIDHPIHTTEAWMQEFMARFCPADRARAEVRLGVAPTMVPQVAEELDADMIALGWRRDLSPGRAAVVRRMLGGNRPVLLVPVAPTDGPAGAIA